MIANIIDNIIWDPISGIRDKVRVEVMAGEGGKGSGIEKFDGTNFVYWRMQIEDYLYGKKLHLPLLGTKPETMKDEDWNLLDRQVLGVIRLTLSRSIAHNVVKEKTTMDLMKKLFNLKKTEGTPVVQHLNESNTITNQLSLVEIEFDDKACALSIFASLL